MMEHSNSVQVECQPITSLEDLLAWNEEKTPHQPVQITRTPLAQFDCDGRPLAGCEQPKLLVCHDMKGGYLDDRWYGGHNDPSAYTFYHWSLVDEFVYFSHELVTVPPCAWVDAAHIHGVAIYGTLMTEFDAGAAICRRLLRSEETVDAVVDRLVAVSRHHGLDGWLLNIENPIDTQQLPTLSYLVRRLTERMHEAVPHSRVIWYDSVTRDGELRWQDQLNELNECFFRLCDGIFLNYCWTPAGLAASQRRAGPRRRDVYVGVDVFGRGCPGGGGFNSVQPVAEARWLGLSAALFAPGWTHERLGAERFAAAEDALWDRLARLLPVSGPARLPLVTSFCQGRGLRRYSHGQVTDESPWHRLSCQQRQPSHLQGSRPADLPLTDADGRPVPAAFQLSCPAALGAAEDGERAERWRAERRRIEAVCAAGESPLQPGWLAHHTLEDALDGGGCLALANRSGRRAVYRLFSCDLSPEVGAGGSSLAVLYALKPTGGTTTDDCALCADLAVPADGDTVSRVMLASAAAAAEYSWKASVESDTDSVTCLTPLSADRLRDAPPAAAPPGPAQGGWITRLYRLKGPSAGRPPRLRSIGVSLASGGSALLGYLAVHAWPGSETEG
ncbi:Cytosolic endo-beta-N-acetylglucosaminidase [Amphibalanus amphitrite]|uniref:Cytosolic endo-beta-N-acetylglucosaminidase n=1 Tax=Amphibalanus amphitrite TaxID=1232801 RepID=A0A6A4W2U0_AMPAM|nr:Cytosolic endo-beta-N-acetylglucosaminidase [Amphibalanus amphitrite]KAF0296328.1 Cytosolic endo-beta-N-acetylglucosaminidase [Amphibalanus amphitrite]